MTTACPSAAPTFAPTFSPTIHPCNDGSHDCDLASTYCANRTNGVSLYTCECLRGFHRYDGCFGCSFVSCVSTDAPTTAPTATPTTSPTSNPTSIPTATPTAGPTAVPSALPTPAPSFFPTAGPTAAPTGAPTLAPTAVPTTPPTPAPQQVAQSGVFPEPSGASWLFYLIILAALLCVGVGGFMLGRRQRNPSQEDRAAFTNPLCVHSA